VLALIESRDPKQYIQRMKQSDSELGKGWVQIVHTLAVKVIDIFGNDTMTLVPVTAG